MKLDTGQVWTDATALARGQAELLLVVAGAFIMLPMLLVELFIPFTATAKTLAEFAAAFEAYGRQHGGWLFLVSVVSNFGAATILALLVDPSRPTVAQAMRIALRLLVWFVLLNLLVGLILMGGTALFLLPGAYLLGRTAPAQVAQVAEGLTSPIQALRRGFAVTRGNGWRTFFLIAIIWITGSIVIRAVALAVGIVGTLVGGGQIAAFVLALVSTALGTALGVLLLLVYVAVYRQLGGKS